MSKESKILTELENKLRELTNVTGGGFTPIKDAFFFEYINLKKNCIWYCGKFKKIKYFVIGVEYETQPTN